MGAKSAIIDLVGWGPTNAREFGTRRQAWDQVRLAVFRESPPAGIALALTETLVDVALRRFERQERQRQIRAEGRALNRLRKYCQAERRRQSLSARERRREIAEIFRRR